MTFSGHPLEKLAALSSSVQRSSSACQRGKERVRDLAGNQAPCPASMSHTIGASLEIRGELGGRVTRMQNRCAGRESARVCTSVHGANTRLWVSWVGCAGLTSDSHTLCVMWSPPISFPFSPPPTLLLFSKLNFQGTLTWHCCQWLF